MFSEEIEVIHKFQRPEDLGQVERNGVEMVSSWWFSRLSSLCLWSHIESAHI